MSIHDEIKRHRHKINVKRRIRHLEERSVELGAFVSNHGFYPGVEDDLYELRSIEREIAELRKEYES